MNLQDSFGQNLRPRGQRLDLQLTSLLASEHAAEGALLDHDAHDLVEDIGRRHGGELGVGVVRGLVWCQLVAQIMDGVQGNLRQPRQCQQR